MVDRHQFETARQRAARIWRNHQIQRTTNHEPSTDPESKEETESVHLDQLQARFRKEIRAVITERTNKPLQLYLIAVKIKRKMLLAKLKRELAHRKEQVHDQGQ